MDQNEYHTERLKQVLDAPATFAAHTKILPPHILKHSSFSDSFKDGTDTVNVISRAYSDRLMHNSHTWDDRRHTLHRFMSSRFFELLLTVIISAQFALAVHETNLGADKSVVPAWVKQANLSCLTFYCFELCLRFFIYRCDFFRSKFHWLDVGVVALDLGHEMVALFADYDSAAFSVFRMVRFLKIGRAGRLLRFSPEIFIMIHSLAGAMRVICWAGLMLLVLTTMWSMLAVEYIHPLNLRVGTEDCKIAFSSVYQSNLSFLQTMVAGDNFGECTMPLMREYPATALFFLTVLASIGFGVLNLVLSAIVDRASQVRAENDHMLTLAKLHFYEAAKNTIQKVCRSLHPTETGIIALEDLMNAYQNNPEFAAAIDTLGLGASHISEVFLMMDEDKTGYVNHDEFAEHLLRMKTQDEHKTVSMIKSTLNDLRHRMREGFELVKEEQRELQFLVQANKEEQRELQVLEEQGRAASKELAAAAQVQKDARSFGSPRPSFGRQSTGSLETFQTMAGIAAGSLEGPTQTIPFENGINSLTSELEAALVGCQVGATDGNDTDLNLFRQEKQNIARILHEAAQLVRDQGAELTSLSCLLSGMDPNALLSTQMDGITLSDRQLGRARELSADASHKAKKAAEFFHGVGSLSSANTGREASEANGIDPTMNSSIATSEHTGDKLVVDLEHVRLSL